MFFRYNLPAVFWAILIFCLCAVPGNDLPKSYWFDFPGFDKLVHVFLYTVLEWLILFGFTKQNDYLVISKYAVLISLS